MRFFITVLPLQCSSRCLSSIHTACNKIEWVLLSKFTGNFPKKSQTPHHGQMSQERINFISKTNSGCSLSPMQNFFGALHSPSCLQAAMLTLVGRWLRFVAIIVLCTVELCTWQLLSVHVLTWKYDSASVGDCSVLL